MQKPIYLLLFLVCVPVMTYAQGGVMPVEPYHYFLNSISNTSSYSTPRYLGIAGSGVALGGDPGSSAFNPAGLGQVKTSQMSFGLGTAVGWASTEFIGQTSNATKANIFVPNINVAFASKQDYKGSVTGITFGMSVNRVNDFNRSYTLEGYNDQLYEDQNTGDFYGNRFIEYSLDQAVGYQHHELDGIVGEEIFPFEMAYSSGLISPDRTIPGAYFSDIAPSAFWQKEDIAETGAQYDINFALGMSIQDRLYLGAGLGVQHIYLNQNKKYTEDHSSRNGIINGISLEQNFSMTGIGINLQLGAIYRLHDYLRVGINYRTRTAHRVSETYQSSLDVDYHTNVSTDVSIDGLPLRANYTMSTPSQLTGGIAAFLGKKGFFTVDASYTNYSGATLTNPDVNGISPQIVAENTLLIYRAVLSLKAGAEFKMGDWRIRGGYAHLPNPQVDIRDKLKSQQHITAGAGYYAETFNLNVGVGYLNGSQKDYSPIEVDGAELLTSTSAFSKVRLHIGLGIFFD